MSEPIFAYELRRADELLRLAGMEELLELALDLRWSWDHGADEIWRPLAPELWDLTRNPWVILQTVAPGKLKELAATPSSGPGWKPWPRRCALPAARPLRFKRPRLRRR